MSEAEAGELVGNVIGLALLGGFALAYYGCVLFGAYRLYRALLRLPREGTLQPWMPFLMVLPCLGTLMAFFVYPTIARLTTQELQRHSAEADNTFPNIGTALCVVAGLTFVPYLNLCFFPGLPVLWAIYHVQLNQRMARLEALGKDRVAAFE